MRELREHTTHANTSSEHLNNPTSKKAFLFSLLDLQPENSDDLKANGSKGSNVGSGCSNGKSKNDDMDSDDGGYDSLASDASTGPAQVKVLNGKEKKIHEKRDNSVHEHDSGEQGEIRTKLANSCDKKAGKMKKGEEKTTRRGHNKRRSSCSSRTSFFK